MKQFNITGMSCAACSARVEKAVNSVEGVKSCSVNLLTNSMNVEGDISAEKIIEAVTKAGYGATEKGKDNACSSSKETISENKEISILKNRLIYSIVFLIILMYFSMGHSMFGFPLPSFLINNHIAMGLIQLLLTIAVMVINQKFFINGFKGLIHKAPNMDTLVALGSGSAFLYSVYALFLMTNAQLENNSELVLSYMHEFYFESSAMILALITVGKMLEAYSKGKTTNALKGLINLAPKTATIYENGQEKTISIEQLKKGDIFFVRPGESIPADGVVIDGTSTVDESSITGESIPVDKTIGSSVTSATINQFGFIKCEALRVGKDTTLSQIIQMVNDASSTKAPIAKIADKVSGIFVPTVIIIAVITAIVWLLLGESVGFSLARAISVLVISCPCALGLATPVAIMVGNGIGARNGILFKNAISLEQAGKTEIAVFDKTGTITSGKPEVTDIIPLNGISEKELLLLSSSLEKKSEHPLSIAILKKAEELHIIPEDVSEFSSVTGNGLTGIYKKSRLYGGNYNYINNITKIPPNILKTAEELSENGKTPLYFCKDNSLIGIIAVADTLKSDSIKAINQLKNMGIKVIMLTGDNKRTANAIGKQINADEVIAEVLPQGKEKVVRSLKKQGKVAMIGDGINDAPALTTADVAIAIGAGTDIAIDAADIVLMKNNLTDVPAAIRLSRHTIKNICENLFWAFFYNAIGIPLAAGLFISILGWKLNPMFGAAAMSLSSFCVVTNALRLNLLDIYSSSKDKIIKHKGEKNTMEKTMKINGMMCGHCESAVKKTLESIEGVEKAEVSHEKGTAIVTLSKEISNDVLKKAVEDKDYAVIEIN